MKKSLVMMLMLFIGLAAVTTSCKKDEKKKTPLELLTSGTWYFDSIRERSYSMHCFNDSDSFEFTTDGRLIVGQGAFFLSEGTYTLSADGKTLVITGEREDGENVTITCSVGILNESVLKFSTNSLGDNHEFNLTKTAGSCVAI